jgi:hypothetical protein
MKLKQIYRNCSMSRRINGKMITFDVINTLEKDYKFFYDNGFDDLFEKQIEEIREVKTIEFKNDFETPIKVNKTKKYDTPDDKRNK